MEINIDRIKNRFGNKILKEDIVKIYNQLKKINDVVKLRLGLEESIVKYFKSKLNIEIFRETYIFGIAAILFFAYFVYRNEKETILTIIRRK